MNQLRNHLNAQGQVLRWPSKPREKTAVVEYLASRFAHGKTYSESEVNEILKAWHTFEDWALLRRELFGRGFFERELNGSSYVRTDKVAEAAEVAEVQTKPRREVLFRVEGLGVRRLNPGDLPALARLVTACADYSRMSDGVLLDPDQAAREILEDRPPGKTADQTYNLGLFARQGLVGVLELAQAYPHPDAWYVGLLMFDPAVRGQRLGERTMGALETWLIGLGAGRLMLSVLEENRAALRFWRRQGFSVNRVLPPRQFGQKVHTRLEMTKVLGEATMEHRLKLENILEASRRIDPVFLDSPQYHAESLSAVLGCEFVAKVETLNPIRSFKGRGADYFISKVVERGETRQLVCASAGNFGQAMGYACRKHKLPLVVYASVNANPLKLERMRALGAEVRLFGQDFDAAKLEAKRFCQQTGAWMVEDGKEPAISEGAGTIALELLRHPEPFDTVLVPLGNGAMLGGMARWLKAHSPVTQVLGVCAAGASITERAWRAGRYMEAEKVETIADGIGVRVPIPEALEDIKTLVDDILLVEDDLTLRAMRLAHEHLGLVLEPSGAVGVAALLNHPQFEGQRVATVLCGSNLTPQQMRDWL